MKVVTDVASRIRNIEEQPLPMGTTSVRIVEKHQDFGAWADQLGAVRVGDDLERLADAARRSPPRRAAPTRRSALDRRTRRKKNRRRRKTMAMMTAATTPLEVVNAVEAIETALGQGAGGLSLGSLL